MTKWAKNQIELVQIITADGHVFDLTTESKNGHWVTNLTGWGMPSIDYITQQGPFQHGVSVRDYRLQPRTVQLMVRGQSCSRNDFWTKRTELLNALRPNRYSKIVATAGYWFARSQYQQLGNTDIYSLVEFQNDVYGGTGPAEGELLKWNGSASWTLVAGILNAQNIIRSLCVFNNELYGGTNPNGKLFKWDGNSAWTEVAPTYAAIPQTDIHSLIVFDDGGGEDLYGGTGGNGLLLVYNAGGGVWNSACNQLIETQILSMVVYNDGGTNRIFAGTYPNGKLLRADIAGGNWILEAAQLGAETHINSLCVYNGRLYGGTSPNGKLYQWNDVNAWVEVANTYGTITTINALQVWKGNLYGVGDECRLLKWTNGVSWVEVAGQFATEITARSMVNVNDRLFAGTENGAYLIEYINRASLTSVPCATLRRVLSNGAIRDLCVFIEEGPEFTQDVANWDEWAYQEVLRFFAPNPVIYDPANKLGFLYVMDPFNTGIVNETEITTYEGTWEEHPTLVITGPINNPIIINESTEERIELEYNIPNTRTVTITLTPGNQTVLDDLNANLIGSVLPESNLQSFHLAPDPEVAGGANSITIRGTGTSTVTNFEIKYHNRYIGI